MDMVNMDVVGMDVVSIGVVCLFKRNHTILQRIPSPNEPKYRTFGQQQQQQQQKQQQYTIYCTIIHDNTAHMAAPDKCESLSALQRADAVFSF